MNPYLKRAQGDLRNYRRLLPYFEEDDAAMLGCCFFMQQAVEKILKAFLWKGYVKSQDGHRIPDIIKDVKKLGIKIPTILEVSADIITTWSSASRYWTNFSVSKATMDELEKVCSELLTLYLTREGAR